MAKRTTLPTVYVPPIVCDPNITIALELIKLATHEPQFKSVLVRAAAHLLDVAGEAFDQVQPNLVPRVKKEKNAKRGSVSKKPVSEIKAAADNVVEANGVSINLDPGNESITFNGKTIEVNERQAAMAQLLARAFGQPIGRDHLQKKLFAHRSGDSAVVAVNQLARDLNEAVRAIGLEAFGVRGIGVMFRPLETT
jgi:DNA-binding response OmpR family regulator